jgi:Reverse transcriptase (RNA-dependent DNA polymerase)
MGSSISENQFMIHILNNLTADYDLQLALLERRIGDKDNPLTVEEIRAELSLRFERLTNNLSNNDDNEEAEEMALFGGQFKGKCRNCGKIGHKSFQCKGPANYNGGNNGGTTTGGIYCTYCRKSGHVKQNCLKLKRKNTRGSNNHPSNNNNGNSDRENFDSQDMVFAATSKTEKFTNDIWICDSGACCHYCISDEGLFDVKDIHESIKVGNGNTMMASKVGSLKCRTIQVDGSGIDITLHEVKYVPDLWANLFSVHQALKKGHKLSNQDVIISLSKGSSSNTFDRIYNTKDDGRVTGIKMSVYNSSVAYSSITDPVSKKNIDINLFHKMLGHCGSDRLVKTANIHDFTLHGEFKPCEECATAKARQKNVNKDWKGGSHVPGERLYIDISSVKDASYGGSKFWTLIVDDCTDFCWSIFLKNKSELKDKMLSLLTDLTIVGINVNYIRCNDSGENKSFYSACREKGYKIKFEFSGPRMPQRNGKVERKFQTFYGRIRAMLNNAGLKNGVRSGVWAECAKTVTFLSNITTIKVQQKCPFQLLYGCKPKLAPSLRFFGEMGVVTTKKDIQGKLKNRGMTCMFMGYSVDHSNDVYRMLNLETKKIILSRDIVWLNRSYTEWISSRSILKDESEYDDDDNFLERMKKLTHEPNEEVIDDHKKKEISSKKVYRQMKILESSFNPEASKVVTDIEQGRETFLDQVNVAMFSSASGFQEEPKTFDEAWNHQDSVMREKWRNAINKEFEEMNKKQVWEVIKKVDIPQNRRTIKCKWIFKIKRNGVYRARLVACGYSQVPGVDFNESFAPVINDVSFRIMLISKLIWKLKACIVDVETAFLHGELQEEIYMDVPDGLNAGFDNVLRLSKTIYGLVQSAREFYKKLISVLKLMGFKENKSDPCLLSRWEGEELTLVGIYVDDCLVIGRDKHIGKLIDDLKDNGFNLKIEHDLNDYLSCRIIEDINLNQILILQPHLINNLESKFGKEVEGKRVYKTPGTPRFKIIRTTDDDNAIDSNLQSRYRSGVGMLLFLTKHSRPDICNIVRELSKCMDKATMGTYQEMLRVVKFVIDTKNFCLKIRPITKVKNWSLKVFSDNDWAGDSESRISITGFMIYLMNVPICWRSKAQRGVTLSSSEAEYVAISESVKEIKFV